MCIALPTWIATPVESGANIGHRSDNTITLLFEKHNTMLIIEFTTLGFNGWDVVNAG